MKSYDAVKKELIENNQQLFWFTPANKKMEIDEDQLVETILNYGDERAVKNLIEIMGISKVAAIFKNQISMSNRRQNNYHELVLNFFELYFHRHAPNYTVG